MNKYNKIGWEAIGCEYTNPLDLDTLVISNDVLKIDFLISSNLYLQGETKSIKIPLTDLGLNDFADAWKEILKIPEAAKILNKYKLLMEEI